MEELMKKLEELYNEKDNYYVDEYDKWAYFKDSELYDEVTTLCCGKLITNDGACNWDNINILRNNGYSVFAGDRDSFGWLVGCIRKHDDKRTVCYG